MSSLLILVASSGVLYLIYAILTRLSRKHIPSAHFTSPFTALWLSRHRRDGKTGISTILKLHYPPSSPPIPILRLSPTELSVASVEGLRTIYNGGFEKDEFYSQFANYGGERNMVSMLENKEHAVRKKMLSTVYTKSFIQSSSSVQDLATTLIYTRLGPVLRDVVSKGTKERKEEWGEWDAYVMNLAMGADFTSAFLLGVESCTGFIQDLPAAKTFLYMWKIKSRELPGHEKATQQLEAFLQKRVRKSRDRENASQSMTRDQEGVVRAHFQSQLDAKQEKWNEVNGEQVRQGDDEERTVASELLDHLIAGVETARITLTYLQHELSLPHNSSLQTSLRAELRSLSTPISLSIPHSAGASGKDAQLPSPRDIDNLPLLDAILKETLRLYPPSPAPLPRVVPQGGTTLHGFFVPAGTVVGTSSHVLHQNPSVFVEPRAFKPERWVVKVGDEVAEEKLREMNRYFWPFGSGARMCIGNHFAIYMLKVITVALYTSFETCILDDEGIEQEDAFLAGPVGEKLVLGLRTVA